MTSPAIFNIKDKAYLMEIDDCSSLATNLIFNKSNSIVDRARKIWGDLSFQDQIENRQRVILLKYQPIGNSDEISCVSDSDEVYHFRLVTKELWDSKVLPMLKIPFEEQQILNEQIKTTENIQKFLTNQ